MRTTNLILACLLLLTALACKKSNQPRNTIIGNYEGTFKRYNTDFNSTAQVVLNFQTIGWNGTSDTLKYPAIGNGSSRLIDNEVIEFFNKQAWTADFDWTLILNGSYLLQRNDDSLVFTKSYGNGTVDVYKLKKIK